MRVIRAATVAGLVLGVSMSISEPGALAAPRTAASAAGPVISSVSSVDINGVGTEVQVAATSANPITGLNATLSLGATTTSTTAFTLVSGTDTDGVWQTTGSLGLAYGSWGASVTAGDNAGNQSPAATGTVDYTRRAPVVTGAFDRDHLDFEHQDLTLSGKVWAYDPATGLDDPAWADSTVELWQPGQMVPVHVAADGSYTVTTAADAGAVSYPVPASIGFFTVVIPSSGSGLQDANGPKSSVAFAQNPVRTVPDGPIVYKYGQTLTISGTEQYFSFDSQTWKPLADSAVAVNNASPEQTAPTDAAGHFTWSTTNGPSSSGNWNVHLPETHSAYLADSNTPVHITTIARTALCLCTSWLNQYSQLHVEGSIFAVDNGVLANRRVYLQQTQDGHTWTTLGYLLSDASGNFKVDAYVAVPHGYWRLYYPGDANDQPAYSNVVHFYLFTTVVTGGKPTTTSTYRGRTLSFSGSVMAQGKGPWAAVPHQRVYLLFRAAGSTRWTVVSAVVTDRYGHYRLYGRAARSGTWVVVYLADSTHVDASGPMTYVRVH